MVLNFSNAIIEKTKKISSLLMMSLLLLISPLIAWGQAVSGVTGVVTDLNGGLIPGVEVKLTDTKTSREISTKSNDQGVYTFNNIQPGVGYKLTFTAQGFQTYVLNDVQLGIGQIQTQNVQLTTGQVSGTVEVSTTSGDATLNTSDASIGNVIGSRQLRELPIQLRDNPAALIGLQPGVIGNNVGTGASNRVGSVTGARADQGNITVDGIDANDQATGQAFVTVGNLPIDSVQEFRAVTTNPNASEGRSSGGQIQLSTKSGNNQYHGSLREYYRTNATSANSFFNNKNGVARPKLLRNQFGASLGGPLTLPNFGEGGPMFKSGKDKIFFFFDYEGRRDASQSSVTRTVPLQNLREGRIGFLNDAPGCSAIPIAQVRLDTNPQCITFLTQAQVAALDPRGIGVNQALLTFINNRYPQANDLTGGDGINTGLYRFNAPVTLSNNTYTPRIDWNISKNQTLFGRATITRNAQTNSIELFPGDGDSAQLIDKSYQFAAGHTWVINSSLTNIITAGVSKQAWNFPVPTSAAFPTSFTFPVISSPFASISFQNRYVTTPTFRDDVTWTVSSHTIQFGAQFKPIRQRSTLINDFNFATLGLGGLTTTLNASLRPTLGSTAAGNDDPNRLRPGSSTATSNFDSAFTFLLGRLASLNTNYTYQTDGTVNPLGSGRTTDYVYNEYEFYAQDNWRIRNDLTLNLGFRYYLYPAPYEKNGLQSGNDVDFEALLAKRIANGQAGISGVNATPLLSYNLIGKANNGRPMYATDKNNFAPRFGFSYNPAFENGFLKTVFGDRKTVISGGGSMVYDRVGGAITFIQNQLGYLFDNNTSRTFGNLNPVTALLTDPRFTSINTLPVQNVAPTITKPFTPDAEGLATGSYNYAVAQNFQIPYSYQWNLTYQREVPGNMILTTSYVGRKARKLFAQSDASQIVDFKDPASGQFMIAALNAVQAQLNAGVAVSSLTPQPWLENQIKSAANATYGANCNQFGLGANCTQLLANFIPDLVAQGGTADVVTVLFQNGLLNPNVGLGSQFAVNAYVTNQGYSNYNAMLVSLRKRFSKGFQFDANYTWSHSIDNQSNITNAVSEGLVFDALNSTAGRGNADFDIRHLFNANGIWELPIGRGRTFGGNMSKWADALVGGWTLSGILTARSGLPITSYSLAWSVTEFTGANAGVPSVLTGNNTNFATNIRDEGTGIQYFADPAAVMATLRYPRHGEVGNRNIFRTQGFFDIDAVLSKKFKAPWAENHFITFRAEAYNLTNSNFFGAPDLTLNSTTFGRITGSQSSPRVMQFALRYDF